MTTYPDDLEMSLDRAHFPRDRAELQAADDASVPADFPIPLPTGRGFGHETPPMRLLPDVPRRTRDPISLSAALARRAEAERNDRHARSAIGERARHREELVFARNDAYEAGVKEGHRTARFERTNLLLAAVAIGTALGCAAMPWAWRLVTGWLGLQ